MNVTFANTPSKKAVFDAWQVIADSLSEKHGVTVKVVEVKEENDEKEDVSKLSS